MKDKNLNSIKGSGFKTPDNYFEKFDEKMLNQVKISQKVEQSGFEIPDPYFESFDENLMEKISHEMDSSKVIPLFSWKKVIGIAAVAACLLLMFNLFYPEQPNLTFDDLETSSIENYLGVLDFSNDEIATLLSEESWNKEIFIDQNIEEEQLKEYLLDSNLEELILN